MTNDGLSTQRVYSVGFAAASLSGLFASDPSYITEALEASWASDAPVTRYGRTWYLSRPQQFDTLWFGRIGYIAEDAVPTMFWDPLNEDFVQTAASGGVIVPFVFHIRDGVIAFQLRGGLVRPTTFTGALQSLLNQHGPYPWEVEPLVTSAPFGAWLERVERVSEARFTLQYPNPNFHGNKLPEQLLDELRARTARVSLRAGDDDSIDVRSDAFGQMLDHVQRKYGAGVVRGIDGNGAESEWRSTDGGTVPVQTKVVGAGGDEIPDQGLVEAINRPVLNGVRRATREEDDDAQA